MSKAQYGLHQLEYFDLCETEDPNHHGREPQETEVRRGEERELPHAHLSSCKLNSRK